MAKIVLTSARDIALDKLVASDVNVRRIKAGVSVEDLAEDIARRGLLQSLNVRPELDGEGAETGRFTRDGGRAAARGAQTSGEAKAPGQECAGPLHREGGRNRGGRFARREHDARGAVRSPPNKLSSCRPIMACAANVGSSVPAALARTTLEATATPQACQRGADLLGLHPCHVANGRARGEPFALT